MTTYRCDNEQCGMEKRSRTDLAIYGTCKECGTGFLRRVRAAPPPAPTVDATASRAADEVVYTGSALADAIAQTRAAAESDAGALREVLGEVLYLYRPTPEDGGWSGYLDRLGMDFYRETGIWPHFKSAPMEIHIEGSDEERRGAWSKWIELKRDAAAERARALLSRKPTP